MHPRLLGVIAIVVLTSLPASVVAQTAGGQNTAAAQVRQVYDQWFAAFDKGDGATMDRLEVPNLVLVNPDGAGTVWHKPGPRAGKQKPTGVKNRGLRDVQVRQFGDLAILTGLMTAQAGSERADAASTIVFVRQSGRWLIASGQWSDVPAKEAARK
jgi:ketosteroid isomerase-like protein